MPDEKLYSALEILAMNLQGLPTSKGKLLARAEKEEWFYETRVGLGGVRKVFKIPKLYLPGYKYPSEDKKEEVHSKAPPVAGAIMNGKVVDSKQLASAIRALDEYLKENGLVIDEPETKAEIVAILYNYLEKDATGNELRDLIRVIMR